MSAFIIGLPIIGGKVVPVQFKGGLAVLLTAVVYPFVEFSGSPSSFLELGLVIISEILLGLLLCLLCTVIFDVFRSAGDYIGTEIGFRMINIIDPYNDSQFSLMDAFLYFFAVLVFFTINGHHLMIDSVVSSFKMIPIGGLVLRPAFGINMIAVFSWMFYFAVLMALPIVASGLIVHVALGVVAKTAPRIQVFLISFPLKIGMGLGMMILIFPGLTMLISVVYAKVYEEMIAALRMLS